MFGSQIAGLRRWIDVDGKNAALVVHSPAYFPRNSSSSVRPLDDLPRLDRTFATDGSESVPHRHSAEQGVVATIQTDGNLTVTKNGKALFRTGTQGKDVTLHVQDDENLTLRTPDGKVLWARR